MNKGQIKRLRISLGVVIYFFVGSSIFAAIIIAIDFLLAIIFVFLVIGAFYAILSWIKWIIYGS